ncbi:MAG TPA: flavin reductase family protein [Thermoanaerobaculia bacterium]|nr:flavin reductase family protein [Thermoanaerobaculia bacterium]
MPIDDAGFKLAMSHFASGVTVVTTEHEGARYGMTVSAFSSLSLHPPLVLVCIEKNVKSHEAIAKAKKFGVSVLSSSQADLSNRFASRRDDKFDGVAIRTGELDVPLIEGAICTLVCKLHESLPGGDHTVFVGEVVDAHSNESAPLVYFRSGYRELT